jgi:predicted DNA-binding transcriptional regulator AlpA
VAKWFLTIEVASPSSDEDVDIEQLAEFPHLLDSYNDNYEATASGGGSRYGVVMKIDQEEDDPRPALRQGLDDFYSARQKCGLPDWSVVRSELLTSDEVVLRLALNRPTRLLHEVVAAQLIEDEELQQFRILGAREVTDFLGVTRQRFSQLVGREDFPQPIARLAATPVWLTSGVESYARRRRTAPGRPPASWKVEPMSQESPSEPSR